MRDDRTLESARVRYDLEATHAARVEQGQPARDRVTGAQAIIGSLVASGVDICFANPGTSETHLAAALEDVDGMRPVLALAETVVTGAADGYARMTGRPACTLLHLASGLADGLSNLHNARRAASPVVNLVGDHSSDHLRCDSPLVSDIAGIARPVSAWIERCPAADHAADAAARAVEAAVAPPGQVATLIVPADAAWNTTTNGVHAYPRPTFDQVPDRRVAEIAEAMSSRGRLAFLLRGSCLLEEGLSLAGRIAARHGARLLCDTFAPRLQRGAGRVPVERLPYASEQARSFLADVRTLVLVGSHAPVGTFGDPDGSGRVVADGVRTITLAHPHEDGVEALRGLADRSGSWSRPAEGARSAPKAWRGDAALVPETVMRVVARHLPDQAIVSDESASSGFPHYHLTSGAPPHDYLNVTGGALGSMLSVAVGAAVACPDRKVVALQGDGGAMYNPQALWTMAHEGLDVTVVIYANRRYAILYREFDRLAGAAAGSAAERLFDVQGPDLDWVSLARGFGVDAVSVGTTSAFEDAFGAAMRDRGPRLIEALI